MNWEEAIQRLNEVLSQYMVPGVNPFFGLTYLKSLKVRYESGERTQELYDEMMECE